MMEKVHGCAQTGTDTVIWRVRRERESEKLVGGGGRAPKISKKWKKSRRFEIQNATYREVRGYVREWKSLFINIGELLTVVSFCV